MKIKLLLVLVILFAGSGFSQIENRIYLWPDKVPGQKADKAEPALKPDRGDNVFRLTNVTNPLLEVFKPEKTVHNGIGVIVCPGGGFQHLAINKEGYEVAEWLRKLGYTAFVLQYRVPNNISGALNDIQRAIKIVRSKAYLWKLDAHKLGVMGFSAGANLSVRAGTQFARQTYTTVDAADSVSSRPDFAMLIYAGGFDRGENGELDSELKPVQDTPPMFIFGTADDRHGNSSLIMAGALRDAGIPVELHLLPFGGHGYGLRKGNTAAESWPGFAERWLQTHVNQ